MRRGVRPDREAVRTYCECVFGYAEGLVPLRIFAEKGGPDLPRQTPFVAADDKLAEAVWRAAETAAERGAALYVVPGTVARPGRAAAADVAQLTTVLVDLDDGDIAAKRAHLARHLGEPSLEVASGGVTADGQAKLHLYWRLTEPASDGDVQLVCRLRGAIAGKVGGDPAFASAHQPIRVAGSVYGKNGVLRPVRILAGRERDVDLREFAAAVGAMPALTGHAAADSGSGRTRGPGARALLTRPIREGGADGTTRFEALSRVSGYWIRRAREGLVSLDQAWQEVCVVTVTETEQGRPWAESRLKAVTGGDRIKARFMRQDFFEFVPQFKLIVLGNHKPAIRSPDEAMRRRLHLVPFSVTIPPAERDPQLVEKLLAERDGILRWVLDGCAEVQRIGLAAPAAVVHATRDYFEEEDAIGEWLSERCSPEPSAVTPTKQLFTDWIRFTDGVDTPVRTKTALSQELSKRGYRPARDRRGQRGISGIALRRRNAGADAAGDVR